MKIAGSVLLAASPEVVSISYLCIVYIMFGKEVGCLVTFGDSFRPLLLAKSC